MVGKLDYKTGERDMVILQHRLTVQEAKAKKVILSTLVDYGVPGGDSAMARTVALPAAIGADLILQGRIKLRGVLAPVHKEIYEPVLDRLESLHIRFYERTQEA
jgi:saccharopine dehydrogenase-like NADP-dependent oxidoreductase